MEVKPNNVSVSVFAYTDVGRQRSGNEDAFLIADLTTGKVGLRPDMVMHPVGERGSLLIVSDGMGGAVAGEIASEMAVKSIHQSLLEIPLDMDAYERLRIATEVANEIIWNEAQQDTALAGMGTTVTAALVQGSLAHIAQVGDSRAYLIRGEQIKQITKDQSYAQMLVDSGVIKPEEMHSVPQNVIAQALGILPAIQVALTSVRICRDDYLILCSDGLSGKITADEIKRVVREAADLDSACRRLVDIANERGGEDNITVVTARFDGVGLEIAKDSQTISGSFQTLGQGQADKKVDTSTMQLASVGPPPAEQKRAATVSSAGSSSPAEELPPSRIATAPLSPSPHPPQPARRTAPLASDDQLFLPAQQSEPSPAPPSSKTGNRIRFVFIGLVILLMLLVTAFLIYKFAWPELSDALFD